MRRYSSTAQATTLSAGCTSSATSIQVTATTGFPAVDFILALDYGAAGQELVLVTNVAGTTLTVTRGYNSTPAAAHSLGAVVRHVHAAIDFTDSRTHEAATSAVHGLAGTVVGTTDVQALSNKDLTAGTNTFPASLCTDAELATHAALTVTHGATGAVMGTTNVQAVTNKDLTSGTNTFPTSLVTLTGSQTLTNKTLTAPVIDTLAGVTGVGQARYIKKTVDETVTSSTVLQSDDVFTFTVAANADYEFRLFINNPNSTGGIKLAWSLPAGATYTTGTGSSTSFDLASGATFLDTGAAGGFRVNENGRIAVSATAGSATLQWAQSVSDAGGSTIKAGSFLVVTRIA